MLVSLPQFIVFMHANYPQSTLKFCIPTFYLSLYSNVANFGCKLNTVNRTRLEMSRILNVRLLHMTLIVPLYTLLYELSSKSEEESRKCSWIAPPPFRSKWLLYICWNICVRKICEKSCGHPTSPLPLRKFPCLLTMAPKLSNLDWNNILYIFCIKQFKSGVLWILIYEVWEPRV